jgi:hypothetical protein
MSTMKKIVEYMTVPGFLSDKDRRNIEDYLMQKWGLSTGGFQPFIGGRYGHADWMPPRAHISFLESSKGNSVIIVTDDREI